MRKNHDETSPNVRAGNVMGSQTTSQLNEPAVIPQRFNSTSQPFAGSIVNPELNSISEPKTK